MHFKRIFRLRHLLDFRIVWEALVTREGRHSSVRVGNFKYYTRVSERIHIRAEYADASFMLTMSRIS